MTQDEFFASQPLPQTLYGLICQAVNRFGSASTRVSKSQIAFRRRRAFAWVWLPGRYLRGHAAPLVLSVALPWRDPSPRWKQVLEPTPGRYMHHLELHDPAEIDLDVERWLRQAWASAT